LICAIRVFAPRPRQAKSRESTSKNDARSENMLISGGASRS
jgi:hypothetical protein